MKHVHWITAEPYGIDVLIYVGTWAQFSSYMLRRYGCSMGEQRSAGGHASSLLDDATCHRFQALWLPESPLSTMDGIRALSHELLHAAFCILHHVGVEASYKHQEAICYLHDSLNRQAHRSLNK